MPEPKITVYGAYCCPDCHPAKKFLGEQFIPYHWVDTEIIGEGAAAVISIREYLRGH